MAPPILSYAAPPGRRRWLPGNDVAVAALGVGGTAWGLPILLGAIAGLASLFRLPLLAQGSGIAAVVVGGVLMASGVLIGVTAVAIGPDRGRSTAWLAIQVAAHGAVLLALSAM